MAHLILLRNPLTPTEKEEFELSPGETPIEWLQDNYPTGFGMPIRFYVNADEKPLEELDYVPDIDDIVIIALMPGGFLAAMPLLVKVVIGLAVMAASFFAMQLFAPKTPKAPKQGEERETYTIEGDQNAAKYGDPIPVVYGEVWMTPDYISQPRTFFRHSEAAYSEDMSGIQYLDVILCVGQGYVDIKNVKVGTSDASTLPTAVLWHRFWPHEHGSQMGSIRAAMGSDFYENVVTSMEVDNQEFIKLYDQSQYITVGTPGAVGNIIEIDVVFPNGLYFMSEKGKTSGYKCAFDVYYRQVDDNGNLMPLAGKNYYLIDSGPGPLAYQKNAAELTNPIRRTIRFDTGGHGRWAVAIVRLSNPLPPDEGMTTFVWSGLKLICDKPQYAYGDVTLLAVRVKASRGIGSEAAVRISALCQRHQNCVPYNQWEHTTSPVDAFYDIYTNTKYGAGRPVSELDMPQLSFLKNHWGGYKFNHVFRERSTVWEALKTVTVGLAAEPLPLGSTMTVAQDGVKPVRSMLFTDANIVEGSMKVNYIFDVEDNSDGIEVQYTNPLDWREDFKRYPANSVIPDVVTLPGCTNGTHAAQYARLVWQRTRKQRKRITFDTELEGIILQLGDRIAISHEMPKWGINGQVIAVNGMQIVTDRDLDWSGSGHYMMFRQEDGSPSGVYTVTQGAQPNIAVLSVPLPFYTHVDDEYDYTAFVFGQATTMVRDFTVATTRHTGDTTVTVEAVNYAPEIFDGAMTFLGGAP